MPDNFDYVPKPDPKNFIPFERGKVHYFAYDPVVSLEIIRVKNSEAQFRLRHKEHSVKGWLRLDRPAIALRDQSHMPVLTLILRQTNPALSEAKLQVCAPENLIGVKQ